MSLLRKRASWRASWAHVAGEPKCESIVFLLLFHILLPLSLAGFVFFAQIRWQRRQGCFERGGRAAELEAYLRVPQVYSNVNTLQWWKDHEAEFPHVARMAKQYLGVPATSASVERLFSSVGLVKTDLRGSLLDSTTVDIMWAKHNKE